MDACIEALVTTWQFASPRDEHRAQDEHFESAVEVAYSVKAADRWYSARVVGGIRWDLGLVLSLATACGLGCGRLGYDAVEPDDDGPTIGTPVRITNNSSNERDAAFVQDGSGFALAYVSSDDVYFLLIDRDGNAIGNEILIGASPARADQASLANSGSGFGVAWDENATDIVFAVVDSSGQLVRITPVTTDLAVSKETSVSWNGSEYLVFWRDERSGFAEVYVASFDTTGNSQSGPTQVTPDIQENRRDPVSLHTQTAFHLVWEDFRGSGSNIYHSALDERGALTGAEFAITMDEAQTTDPIITAAGAGLALVFTSDATGTEETYIATLDGQRQIDLPATQLSQVVTSARRPSVAFSGSVFGVAWGDGTPDTSTLHYAQVDGGGSVSNVILIGAGLESEDPLLLFDGTDFCLLWEETLPDGAEELFFVRIAP